MQDIDIVRWAESPVGFYVDRWYDTKSTDGRFKRQEQAFRSYTLHINLETLPRQPRGFPPRLYVTQDGVYWIQIFTRKLTSTFMYLKVLSQRMDHLQVLHWHPRLCPPLLSAKYAVILP